MTLKNPIKIFKKCSWCDKVSSVEVELKAYEFWRAGALIQDAFPTMTKEDREVLITGIHPKCYEDMFCFCKIDPSECEVHNP